MFSNISAINSPDHSSAHLLFLGFLNRFLNMEADHAKSLDIAANRTLTERNRITELLRDIDENR